MTLLEIARSTGSALHADLPYAEPPSHERQALDLCVPAGPPPPALVVWIHGGGWHSGDKSTGDPAPFLQAGFAYAALNYRLTTSDTPFPVPIEDCFRALLWLRRNQSLFQVNAGSIGLVGHSAGAHLSALIAATSGTNWSPESKALGDCVRAAVLWSPPLDLARERGRWPANTFAWNPKDPYCRTFYPGGTYDEAFARWASPASYLRPGQPAMLAVHGERDNVVPFAQAAEYARQAEAIGARLTFRSEPLSDHCTMSEANSREAVRFFQTSLLT